MAENEFSIQELCDQTGLPRRTIHFYIQQEILPPPIGSGLGARYQAEHLLRLKLIPHFRQQGLKLDDIRLKFHTTDRAELEQILAQSAPPHLAPAPAAASRSANPCRPTLSGLSPGARHHRICAQRSCTRGSRPPGTAAAKQRARPLIHLNLRTYLHGETP